MTVGELTAPLKKYPDNWVVHVDVTASDTTGWERDRVVCVAEGVYEYLAIAGIALNEDRPNYIISQLLNMSLSDRILLRNQLGL